jgi:shikimate dehydrogenase
VTNERQPTLVGLLGYPVEHSLSPAMHNAAFRATGLDWQYVAMPIAPKDFARQIDICLSDGLKGWNITVPHKERMVGSLHSKSLEVEATGACNTVLVEDGRLLGFNTDSEGFLAGLRGAGGIEPGSLAVLLGAGGAARAVAWALARAGHEVLVLSRRAEQSEQLVRTLALTAGVIIRHGCLDSLTLGKALNRCALLVNCTPAGMWPNVDTTPLPEGVRLPDDLLVYDLVYRPRPTRLLKEAVDAGCRTVDGLDMLVGQGAAAFELWTGPELAEPRTAPRDVMREACLAELAGDLVTRESR